MPARYVWGNFPTLSRGVGQGDSKKPSVSSSATPAPVADTGIIGYFSVKGSEIGSITGWVEALLPGREEERYGMVDSLSPFLPEDRKEAQWVFNSLPMKQQVEMVLENRGKRRMDILFLSHHPEQIVQQLPEVEIFLSVKEIGERNALDLIHLTTPEQFMYLLDLDLWKKDELDQDRLLLWIEILAGCAESKLQEFLETADQELLATLFRRVIRVLKTESTDEEIVDQQGRGLFNLDRTYYIEFTESKVFLFMKQILEALFGYDASLYQTLMEMMLWDVPAEDEASALRMRDGRLADSGIPGLDEALELYRYLPPELVREEQADWISSGEQGFYPPVYIERSGEASFLVSLLKRGMDEGVERRVRWEIVAVANRVMVAETFPLADVEALHQSAEKALRTLDLGLRYLSHENPDEAMEVIKTIPLARVFQTGFSLGLKLRRKAKSICEKGWLGALDRKEQILDSPLRETMQGLLRKRPEFFCEHCGAIFHPFERLDEIALVEDRLERITILGRGVHEFIGMTADEINRVSSMSVYLPDPPLSAICLTVFANQILKGEKVLSPIGIDDLAKLHFLIVEKEAEEGPARIRPEVRDLLVEKLTGGREEETLRWWFDFLRSRMESSLSGVAPEDMDPRFIDIFMIRK